ncbi:MAG TPA: hypothetical protein VGR64_02025 [Terracidiphilus sp.]|nr:hypothetical protein [Terracidiphilus sp.]HEV2485206.1 hypothetical protein [Terracidiphilus sp.]
MHGRRVFVLFGTIPAFILGFSCVRAQAAGFAITATNVSMPMSGLGSSQYTVTSIPLTGTLTVTCQFAGAATQARIPTCSYGPIMATPVNAGQTVTGTVYFYPYGSVVPLGLRQTGKASAAGLAIAGALLFCLGLRRRARGWLALMVVAVGSLAGLAGICACGGSVSNGMTPGSYPYTISAVNEPASGAAPAQLASTTINVTVP